MNLCHCFFSENKCTTSVFCIKDGFNNNMWCLASIKIPKKCKNCISLILTHHHSVQCHNVTLHRNCMYLVQLNTTHATQEQIAWYVGIISITSIFFVCILCYFGLKFMIPSTRLMIVIIIFKTLKVPLQMRGGQIG